MNRILIAALSVTLLLAFSTATFAQQTSLKIATANPAKIFNEMQETKDLKQALESASSELTGAQKAKEEEIRNGKKALDQLIQGSPQYIQKRKDLIQHSVELETWVKVNQAQIQDQQKYQMKLLFDKITDAVKEVAKDQGLDLVIAETNVDFPDLDQINVDQLRALINQRNVLFGSGKLDVSDQVTAKLDAAYKTRGSVVPAPAVSPAPAPAPAAGK